MVNCPSGSSFDKLRASGRTARGEPVEPRARCVKSALAIDPMMKTDIDPLPPGLSSMWRLCKLGYRHEPGLLVAAFLLALLSAVPDALLALWFKMLGEGVLRGDGGLVRLAAVALGVSAPATWLLRTV